MSELKICFAGLGSIGQRHLKNLTAILQEKNIHFKIDAVRSGNNKLPDDIVNCLDRQYRYISELPKDYDIFFVTNPTANHFETIQKAASRTRHMFIEKPVFEKPYERLDEILPRSKGVRYVACPLRYNPCLSYVRQIWKKEKIFAVRAISSSYLPGWRKAVDYRGVYSADAQRGGGVTLDLIHELDYITDLFGMPEKCVHIKGKYSDLEISSDDLSVYILEYRDKLAEVHLDYFGRETIRQLELFCRDYTIICDFIRNTIRYKWDGQEKEILPEIYDMYKAELETFIKITEGKVRNSNSIEHANELLRMAVQE